MTDISFNDSNISKKLTIILIDTFDFENRLIVTISKEFDVR